MVCCCGRDISEGWLFLFSAIAWYYLYADRAEDGFGAVIIDDLVLVLPSISALSRSAFKKRGYRW